VVPPGGGVITAWSHKANSNSGKQLALRVYRATVTAGTYILAATTSFQTLAPSTVNTFSARVPVSAGDLVGLRVGNTPVFPDIIGGGASCTFTAAAGNTVRAALNTAEPAVGGSGALSSTYLLSRLNVTAQLEPDVDADGFGDETQDACPSTAGVTGGCSASAPGGGTPTGGTPAVDKTPPAVKLSARRQALKRGKLRVSVTPSEDAKVTVAGTVSIPGAAKAHRLRKWSGAMKANRSHVLRLRLPAKARRAVRRALARRKRVRVRVTVSVRDAAGNVGAAKRSVRLKR
jgi:hypothetical protein